MAPLFHYASYGSRSKFFFGFGGFPPVCLTDTLAPDEDADLLLLGGGDVRDLLYTLFVDEAHGRAGKAKLDVTWCGWEPGVIARNVLLFSLLADDPNGKNIDYIWNFYFDMLLTKEAHKLVTKQARKLADLSTTMDVWEQGVYGKWLRMCSINTLEALHSLWTKYADTDALSNTKKKAFTANYLRTKDELHKTCGPGSYYEKAATLLSVLSTGKLGLSEVSLKIAMVQCFQQYWRSGVLGSTSGAKTPTLANPTFAYTGRPEGEGFRLYFLSSPTHGSHLLPLLVQCQNAPKNARKVTAPILASYVKKQFTTWCQNFSKAVMNENQKASSPNLVLRFFTGDLFPFCTALRQCSLGGSVNTGLYPHQWTVKEMVLYDVDYDANCKEKFQNGKAISITTKAPTSFNLINTSTLVDQFGLLNILLATVPVLRKGISSSLQTGSWKNNGLYGESGLETKHHVDLLLIGRFLGVLPASYFYGYSTRSHIERDILRSVSARGQGSFERTNWKLFSVGFRCTSFVTSTIEPEFRRILFDGEELAQFLLVIYQKLFMFELASNPLKGMPVRAVEWDKALMFHSTRETFAKFLLAVKDCVYADKWRYTISRLITLIIGHDRFSGTTRNNVQDLKGHLVLLNVVDMDAPKASSYPPPPKQMLAWREFPKMVCISLVVPRKNLDTLLSCEYFIAMGEKREAPVILQTEIRSGLDYHIFHSLHMVFGKIVPNNAENKTAENSYSIEEDENGRYGSSDLVVVFQALLCVVRCSPDKYTIAFGVDPYAHSAQYFLSKLGEDLIFFRTELNNTSSVYISTRLPNISTSNASICNIPTPEVPNPSKPKAPFDIQTSVRLDGDITKSRTGHAWTGRISVKVTNFPATFSQRLVEFGELFINRSSHGSVRCIFNGPDFNKYHDQWQDIDFADSMGKDLVDIDFPLPIISLAETIIDRESISIEITARISEGDLRSLCSSPLKQFPILESDGRMVLWNMHRVSLDQLPRLDLSVNHEEWLTSHLDSAITPLELQSLDSQGKDKVEGLDTITIIKQVTERLFDSFLKAIGGNATPITLLATAGTGLAYVIPTDIRLDSGSQTIVLDACIVPFYTKITDQPEMMKQFKALRLKSSAYMLEQKEHRAWREFLASYVERARGTSYVHDASKCEYIQAGNAPLPYTTGSKAFLCSCSEGHPSKAFKDNPEYKHLAAIAHRAAISPLFDVDCRSADLPPPDPNRQ